MSISVKELISVLQSMGAKKKGKRKPAKKQASTPGASGSAFVQPLGAGSKPRRRGKKKSATNNIAQGEIVVSRSELLTTVTTGDDGTVGSSKVLIPASLPWLANLAKAFERVRWLSVQIEYRPAVGANTDGTIALGFDWGTPTVKAVEGGWQLVHTIDKAAVLSCTPCADGPVWSKNRMSVPQPRLQSRAWYELSEDVKDNFFDYSPGSLCWFSQGAAKKTMGELWVHYRLQMSGTRKV